MRLPELTTMSAWLEVPTGIRDKRSSQSELESPVIDNWASKDFENWLCMTDSEGQNCGMNL